MFYVSDFETKNKDLNILIVVPPVMVNKTKVIYKMLKFHRSIHR